MPAATHLAAQLLGPMQHLEHLLIYAVWQEAVHKVKQPALVGCGDSEAAQGLRPVRIFVVVVVVVVTISQLTTSMRLAA